MWLLSYVGGDGNLLDGKRLWLRPGTGHLFGRTSSKPATGERCVYIGDKNISRKHVTFRVAPTGSGFSTRLQERTTVTIIDESKKGTYIDGDKLVQGEKVVDGSKASHLIKVGDTEHVLKLEWKEVTLCFTNISRGAKKSGSALAEEKQKLDGCDIKLATDYIANRTTHVVAKKRNTSSGLQALVQGRWLVTSSWFDALADAVKKRGPEESSSLEEDFDGKWPKEVDFIVPASGEPNPKPNDYLKPDPARAEVFSGYTFVFLSQSQYDSLFPVISGGGGKAVRLDFQLGQTTADDVIEQVKSLSGKKGNGQFLLSQEPSPGGIVIVRVVEKEDNREGMRPLLDELSITLNQRTIEQSELLGAILAKDASDLRRPLRDVSQSVRPEQSQSCDDPVTSSSFPRPPKQTPIEVRDSPPADTQPAPRSAQASAQMKPEDNQQQADQPPAAEEVPTRRRNRRMITQPRKINFDDFDPSQFAAPESSVQEPTASSQDPSQSNSVQAMDVDEPATKPSQRNTQKRPAEKQLVKDEEIDEKMFPGMAAMKRRKTEALKRGKTSKQTSNQPTPEPEVSVVAAKAAKGKGGKVKKESEDDIKTRIKKRREDQEEARRKDEEALEEAMTADLANMKVNHVVERFTPPITPVQDYRSQTQSTSQNPAWNGRPNFKKFRSNKRPRHGDELERPDTQRVLVSLEEIPNRSQGLGDDYWLETGHNHQRKQGEASKSQSKSQSQRSSHAPNATAPRQAAGAAGFEGGVGDEIEDEDDTTAFRRRIQRSREEDRNEAEIEKQLVPNGTSGSTQTEGRTQKTSGNKRGALEALLGEKLPPAKKPRAATGKAAIQRARTAQALDLDMDDEDGDEDPMAFKRKRR